jgi:hypothetical protein
MAFSRVEERDAEKLWVTIPRAVKISQLNIKKPSG